MNIFPAGRRDFLKLTLTACLGLPAMQRLVGAGAQNGIPYRMLGRSGAKVSLLGIGGFHLGQKPTEGEAIRIVRTALDEGVNFLDNCWDYNEGQSRCAWVRRCAMGTGSGPFS